MKINSLGMHHVSMRAARAKVATRLPSQPAIGKAQSIIRAAAPDTRKVAR